ncbi:IS3 family transposase [Cereibacter azotoformans]|uniref:IS3 family transposase n=1 Tax=Cereibacter azotoformans TaxID=43057 RepID=UPI000C6D6AD1
MGTVCGTISSASCYGYRRVPHELRRHGLVVNHKRVARVMRVAGLRIKPRRHFVNTTEECQELCVSAAGPVLFDRPQPPIGEKRSSNIMANWLTAVSHPLTVRAVFSYPRIAR